ncbi:hypothetical protein [Streptomyces sp. NPDC000410]|uniref:hypothetical protein n=1 Tax=Streptomyces sp. NPDC000410 TaxID=3154254 RepID=UPI00331C425B
MTELIDFGGQPLDLSTNLCGPDPVDDGNDVTLEFQDMCDGAWVHASSPLEY